MNNLRKLAIVLLMTLVCLVVLGASTSLAGTVASHDHFDAAVASTIQNLQSAQVPTNQIIIKYKASADLRGPRALNGTERLKMLSDVAGVQLTYFREMSGKAHVLRLPERLPLSQVRQIADQLMTIADVEYAEPDAVMQHTLAPNDPRYAEQWHYYETWGINAPAAWDITTGSPNIVVAVIDTGITNHAEFSGRTVPGYDFISSTFSSNDGDGRDSDPSDPGDWVPAGYCYTGSPAENSSWHGTHTAGTIGASSNNGLGVAGINWNSKIQAIRVLGRCGGLTSDIVDGMRWAAGLSVSGVPANANPAKVLNMSLGGSGTCGTTFQNAINEITAAGAVVVVSAGNSNADASGFVPANCNGVITVAATNRSGYRAYYSNYGSVVEISAPGGETTITSNGVLSTLNTGTQGPVADTYAFYQGTSMAAPHVSGVASLLFSLSPSLSPLQVQQIMQNTARAFPAGSTCNTSICGSGIVNAGAAVAVVPRITNLNPATILAGSNSFQLTVYGANFTSGSTVRWNNSPRTTTFVSSNELRATIPASDISVPTLAQITVNVSDSPYGSITTAARTFAVRSETAVDLFLPFITKSSSFSSPTPTPTTPPSSGWQVLVNTDFEGSWPSP
jgi:serine protease